MSTSPEKKEESAFNHAFYGIPNEQEREAMSVLDLAELLSPLEKDSVPYIVLSHELSLKIAKDQAKLSHRSVKVAGVFTIVGAVVGAAATAFFSSQPTQTVIHYRCPENCATETTTSKAQSITNQSVPNKSTVGTPMPTRPKDQKPATSGKQNP
jgi:hypothetical protein